MKSWENLIPQHIVSWYWRFTNESPDPDNPKHISRICLVRKWKIDFFKGSKYWTFDPYQWPPVKSSYPRPISNWEGIPNDVDDALQYTNGYTYFFKKGSYWRFDDRAFRVKKNKLYKLKHNYKILRLMMEILLSHVKLDTGGLAVKLLPTHKVSNTTKRG